MSVLVPIGATVIGGLILFFTLPILEKPRQKFLNAIGVKHKIETQISEEVKLTALPEAPVVPIVDPIEVVNDVGAQPLMQQADKAKHYIGMRVDCIGELFEIEELGNKKTQFVIHVRSNVTSGRYRAGLIFEINPTRYRGIGLLNKRDPVRVSGIIESVTTPLIYLGEAKLISYGKTPAT
jgi:hypothetical protein